MISFYPGPSKVYPQIPQYVREAYEQGLLSINHRSEEFVSMSARTIALLKQRLKVPEDYMVFFTSSATECWEIISQSLVKKSSFHLYNGAFGEKWFAYASKLHPVAHSKPFHKEETIDLQDLHIPDDAELIGITHNETSNGTAVSMKTLSQIRTKYPDRLIAVDATSSMAGVYLDMSLADVWYASVQKCFGLPAGMAVLICSPSAIQKALAVGESQHYNSLVWMIAQMQSWQTTYTPNVLGIYLLMRTLENTPGIEQTEKIIQTRCSQWIQVIESLPYTSLLIKNPEVRSQTVITLEADPATIHKMRAEAKRAGIILGNGYGQLKPTTLRIANFPAMEDDEIEKLQSFLHAFS